MEIHLHQIEQNGLIIYDYIVEVLPKPVLRQTVRVEIVKNVAQTSGCRSKTLVLCMSSLQRVCVPKKYESPIAVVHTSMYVHF